MGLKCFHLNENAFSVLFFSQKLQCHCSVIGIASNALFCLFLTFSRIVFEIGWENGDILINLAIPRGPCTLLVVG